MAKPREPSTRAARLTIGSGIKGERRSSAAVADVGDGGEPVGPKDDSVIVGGEVVPDSGDRRECTDRLEEDEGIM